MSVRQDAERARALRGPLWWRARCWLGQLLGTWACALEPEDRSSASWLGDDGLIHFARIRRPAEPERAFTILAGEGIASQARCPLCFEWSPANQWDEVAFDVFECPECGRDNGPLDAPPEIKRSRRTEQ